MSRTHGERPGRFSFDELRARLNKAVSATEKALQLSTKRAREVMDERARVLARPPAPGGPDTHALELVTFSLANERYGIETRYVREVLCMVDLTPIPGAPSFVLGLVNLRGEILLVVDLHTLFGVSRSGLSDRTRLVILGEERADFGVLVDEFHEILTIEAAEVLAPPHSTGPISRESLRGVTRNALIVLDAFALLKDQRLYVRGGSSEARQ